MATSFLLAQVRFPGVQVSVLFLHYSRVGMGTTYHKQSDPADQTQRSQQWVFVTGTANGKGCARRGGVTVCTARMARSPNDDKESAELIITENTTG
ncbi:hypothetical protein J6590_089757 [Homalodisca vitripennis]|nr:hypothetical protein J6590_089757 [Homalodisca vitripennis]